MPIFCAYAYGLPAIIAFMPLCLPQYWKDVGWCWIDPFSTGGVNTEHSIGGSGTTCYLLYVSLCHSL